MYEVFLGSISYQSFSEDYIQDCTEDNTVSSGGLYRNPRYTYMEIVLFDSIWRRHNYS